MFGSLLRRRDEMLLEVPSGDVGKYHFDLIAHIGWRICSKGKKHCHDILRLAAMEFRKADIELAFDLKRIQVLTHLDWEIVSAMGMGGVPPSTWGSWRQLIVIGDHY